MLITKLIIFLISSLLFQISEIVEQCFLEYLAIHDPKLFRLLLLELNKLTHTITEPDNFYFFFLKNVFNWYIIHVNM